MYFRIPANWLFMPNDWPWTGCRSYQSFILGNLLIILFNMKHCTEEVCVGKRAVAVKDIIYYQIVYWYYT